jgi:multimeric flavodoxin WrbA
MKDDLEPVLHRIRECDALVLGSPVYFSAVTGEMRSFMERLLFPYSSYEGKPSSFGKKIGAAFVYTMNAPAFALPFIGYNKMIKGNNRLMKNIFGGSESLIVTSTYQFDDYGKYAMTLFSGEKRLKRRETVFKEDCKKAYELGGRLCGNK